MKRRDVNQVAYDVVQRAMGEAPRIVQRDDPAAAFGRKGGKKRAAKLSKKRRSAIAAKAAKARWEKNRPRRAGSDR